MGAPFEIASLWSFVHGPFSNCYWLIYVMACILAVKFLILNHIQSGIMAKFLCSCSREQPKTNQRGQIKATVEWLIEGRPSEVSFVWHANVFLKEDCGFVVDPKKPPPSIDPT